MGPFRRAIKIGVPVTLSTALAGVAYCKDELTAFTPTMLETHPAPWIGGRDRPSFWIESAAPISKWNSNWDYRDPESMIDEAKYKSATKDEKEEMLAEETPTATRHIFLIRHGQYHSQSEEKHLTELGREQSKYLGQRLVSFAKYGVKFDPVFISTMTRAKETANLMLEQLDPGINLKSDSMLEEGLPYPMEPSISPHLCPKLNVFYVDGARIEAAFRKHFHRASPEQKGDSYELFVCHGNVIRYFVCRALQLPPEVWLRMSLAHTSITWLTIRPNGIVTLKAFGDVGHLPPNEITLT